MFEQFMEQYATELLNYILIGIAGYLGIVAKNLVEKYINDKTKEKIARIAARGVEQMYKELHGEDKLNRALAAAAEMLTEKGITVTDFELRMLIEDAVGEFNEAFKKAG